MASQIILLACGHMAKLTLLEVPWLPFAGVKIEPPEKMVCPRGCGIVDWIADPEPDPEPVDAPG